MSRRCSNGARPSSLGGKPALAAPCWFVDAVADLPKRSVVQVAEASIETLAWGKRGAPGLLLLHGHGAHADWWRFIAPFLASERHVVAPSLSGMGNSAWRSDYSVEVYAEEVIAVATQSGLLSCAEKPWLVAHSFGSVVALHCLDHIADRVAGLVIVDNGAHALDRVVGPGRAAQAHRLHVDRQALIERFRLQPAQPCPNDWILRFIAEQSVVETEAGWRWKFDPFARQSRGEDHIAATRSRISRGTAPLAFLWGDQSAIMTSDVVDRTRRISPAGTRFVAIPAAAHHVMLDQPLAFVAAVQALIT